MSIPLHAEEIIPLGTVGVRAVPPVCLVCLRPVRRQPESDQWVHAIRPWFPRRQPATDWRQP